jgi:hypothetical protein
VDGHWDGKLSVHPPGKPKERTYIDPTEVKKIAVFMPVGE